MQATAASGDELAERLVKAAQAYEQGDEQNARRVRAAMNAAGGSPRTGAAAEGRGGDTMGQLMSQMGQQAGQLGQSIAQPLQGLQQMSQQVMQGVQQIVQQATQAGGATGAGTAEVDGHLADIVEQKDGPPDGERDAAGAGEDAQAGSAPVDQAATDPASTRPQQA